MSETYAQVSVGSFYVESGAFDRGPGDRAEVLQVFFVDRRI